MIITELQYFPPVSLFKISFIETNIVFDIYEPYRKMSFRNRCLIAGANGIISLSIPLIMGRDQRVPMSEVRIAGSEDWRDRHWKSIQSAYSRSPFFEYYRDELAAIYGSGEEKLVDWNLKCLYWVKDKLGWPPEIRLKTEPEKEEWTGSGTDIRNQVLPKNYMAQPAVRYRQVFEERTGFHPNLSILDLLFNEGAHAGELLRG
ncbi:MAG TPA: WbqC family protein [Puia sp.]|nr:WbqC family protein [Puia sp.]